MDAAGDLGAIPLDEFIAGLARSSGEGSDVRSRPPGLEPEVFGDLDPETFEPEPDHPNEPLWRCLRCDGRG